MQDINSTLFHGVIMGGSITLPPRVDVVIPCYNYGRFLNKCVHSILDQDGVDVRVLIIDDCSSDDTPQVGQSLASTNSRVEYRRHQVNKGHIATYNEGLLEWASAEYSVLLSADDALAPGALARATQLMERHHHVGMTYGMALVVPDNEFPEVSDNSVTTEFRIISGSEFLQQCFDLAYCLISTPTVVARTSVQKKLGGYCADLPHSGDAEMWMRFGFHGSIGVLRSVQAYYRWHGSNMGSKYYNQCIGDQREFWQACKYALDRWGTQHPKRDFWRNLISRRLGEEGFWSASKAFDSNRMAECRAWLEFAEEVCPELRRSAMWWRFWAKRIIGPGLWRIVLPVLNRARGIEAITSNLPKGAEKTPFRFNQEVGWWPG
jgi:glycosyltransferase involved in cell wall biosynthesis